MDAETIVFSIVASITAMVIGLKIRRSQCWRGRMCSMLCAPDALENEEHAQETGSAQV